MASNDFKEQLRAQADIVRIVGEYVQLRKSGAQNFSGLCPFHKEKSPSFSVHATRQFYHCFGCGESGDVFKFIQKIENMTFGEAVRFIAGKLGVPMPKVEYDSPAEARQAALRARLIDINERACAWFQEQLRRPEGTHAREYIAGRGLTPEIIAKFRIGFAPESGFLLRDALRGQFDEEVMKESGLFSWKQDETATEGSRPASANLYSKFRNRVMFPIMNDQGRVIAFTGRTLSTDEKAGPKYLNSPETPVYSKSRVLFNLDKAKEAIRQLGYAILVEGQMDCIAVYAAGFHNVMASSGTAFTETQAKILHRFTKNVVINFDPDAAGRSGSERSLDQLITTAWQHSTDMLVVEDFQLKVVSLPPGFDPDAFLRKFGQDGYVRALKESRGYFDFLIFKAKESHDIRTGDGKVEALKALLPHINRVPSPTLRIDLARRAAAELRIDSAVVLKEIDRAVTQRTNQLSTIPKIQITKAERLIVRALASAVEIAGSDYVSTREGAEEEFDPSRQVRFVFAGERLHEGFPTEALISALLDAKDVDPTTINVSESDRKLLFECLMNASEELTAELIEQAVEALRWQRFERRRQEILRSIADAERKGDLGVLRTLLQEKVDIERALAAGKARSTTVVQ